MHGFLMHRWQAHGFQVHGARVLRLVQLTSTACNMFYLCLQL